jgi:hypothetical protein
VHLTIFWNLELVATPVVTSNKPEKFRLAAGEHDKPAAGINAAGFLCAAAENRASDDRSVNVGIRMVHHHSEDMMMEIVMKHPAAVIAGALAIGFATASWAAPVLSNTAASSHVMPSTATHVDDRGGSRGSNTNTRLLEQLAIGGYRTPASPSTATPSNDVTARPDSSYSSRPNPYGALLGTSRRQR